MIRRVILGSLLVGSAIGFHTTTGGWQHSFAFLTGCLVMTFVGLLRSSDSWFGDD